MVLEDVLDNILLVNEILRGIRRVCTLNRFYLGVDFRKAFDTLRWDVIIASLKHMKFYVPFLKILRILFNLLPSYSWWRVPYLDHS